MGSWAAFTETLLAEKVSNYTMLDMPHMDYCVHLCSPQFKNNVDGLEGIQRRVTKMMIKVQKYLPYEERLKEKGLFTLEKGRLEGHFTTILQYLKGGYKENRGILPTRGNKYKLHPGKVSPLYKKGNFTSENNLKQTP